MFAKLATTLAVDRRQSRRPGALAAQAVGAAAALLPGVRGRPASSDAQDAPRPAGPEELDRLHGSLEGVAAERNPRTAKLLASGTRKAAQKVIEEAGEVALEAVKRDVHGIVSESADLLYHLVVLWHRRGIAPVQVWTEMQRRADLLGIAEKPPKSGKAAAPRSDR